MNNFRQHDSNVLIVDLIVCAAKNMQSYFNTSQCLFDHVLVCCVGQHCTQAVRG